MPLIGSALGAPLGHAIGDSADDVSIGDSADDVAIGVLLAFGLYPLPSADEHEERQLTQLTQLAAARGPRALPLGPGISLDELAITLLAESWWPNPSLTLAQRWRWSLSRCPRR